ncbi:MAG: hypothetical protein Q7W30_05525 [Coriobacteriia bacterium]|nr:hypothetical protein [Coriobacteriia bacterium]
MGFHMTLEPILVEFTLDEREAWFSGERSDCICEYCRRLPGTKGFGEYVVGKYWEQRGYRWIHHDFNVLGGNRPGRWEESEAVVLNALGPDRLAAARTLYKALMPFREEHHNPAEEPDLLIYKPGTTEIRFAECKRADTRDTINTRQALGIYLLGALLRLPVDVFLVAEKGTCSSPDPIVFAYPEGRRLP